MGPQQDKIREYFSDRKQASRDSTLMKMIELYNSKEAYSSGVWNWITEKQPVFKETFKGNKKTDIYEKYSNIFRIRQLSNGLVSSSLLKGIRDPLQDIKTGDIFVDDEEKEVVIKRILEDIEISKDLTEKKTIPGLPATTAGNLYGVVTEEGIYPPDQPRHFYLANRIYNILSDIEEPVIFEIGGGFGGLYLNLLETFGEKKFTYINYDILSTCMAFVYVVENTSDKDVYISKNRGDFISSKIVEDNDVILQVVEKMTDLENILFETKPDICVNFHSLSEMSKGDIETYINAVERNKIKYFLHTNSSSFPWQESLKGHVDINSSEFPINKDKYKMVNKSISPWCAGGHSRYREYFYILKEDKDG